MNVNKHDEYLMRHDNILVVAHNTIRSFTAGLIKTVMEIIVEPVDHMDAIFYAVMATNDIPSFEGAVDDRLVVELVKKSYADIYRSSPTTNIMFALDQMSKSNKLGSTYILHDLSYDGSSKEKQQEPGYNNIYGDGTIESIEHYVKQLNISAIIVHDIEIVRDLLIRNNIHLVGKTFIVPEYRYNRDDETQDDLKFRKELEEIKLRDDTNIEIATMAAYAMDQMLGRPQG